MAVLGNWRTLILEEEVSAGVCGWVWTDETVSFSFSLFFFLLEACKVGEWVTGKSKISYWSVLERKELIRWVACVAVTMVCSDQDNMVCIGGGLLPALLFDFLIPSRIWKENKLRQK